MWQIISIFLQASGVLLLLWILVGWLVLGRDRGGVMVRACLPGHLRRLESFARCCVWLRETGIVHMPVLLVDCGLAPEERKYLERIIENRKGLYWCEEAQLVQWLIQEVERVGGKGAAAGDCDGRGVSKS